MPSIPRLSPPGLLAAALAVPLPGMAGPSGGDALALAFSPSALTFAATAAGESTLMRATLKNTSGVNVALGAFAITGDASGVFSQFNDCPAILPKRQSCHVRVVFLPRTRMISFATLGLDLAPSVTLPLAGNIYPGPLNDTGIQSCGDALSSGLPCPVAGFPGQDAESGRDVYPRSRGSRHGRAGFSFTKLSAKGKALGPGATGWACVRDNLTGLVWEAKPKPDGTIGNQGLHDADDTYSWYDTNSGTNGGDVGFPYGNEVNSCHGYRDGDTQTYCNTEAYAKRVNAVGYCGFQDWRVPDRFELAGLLDLSVPEPGRAIDTAYFPDIPLQPYYISYWTSTPNIYHTDAGSGNIDWSWQVYFSGGFVSGTVRYANLPVRLVRGGL